MRAVQLRHTLREPPLVSAVPLILAIFYVILYFSYFPSVLLFLSLFLLSPIFLIFLLSFNIYLWWLCLSPRTQQLAAARPPHHPLPLRMMPTALLPNKATNAQIQSADSQLQVALPWCPLPAYARVAVGDARLVLPDKVHRIVGGSCRVCCCHASSQSPGKPSQRCNVQSPNAVMIPTV